MKTKSEYILKLIDEYLDIVEKNFRKQDQEINFFEIEEKYNTVVKAVEYVCSRALPEYTEQVEKTAKNSTNYKKCDSCQGWGCYNCCSSPEEIRARQGTFG